jgi:uncharacterized membrane protein YdjX (TVP38/TMEM64 family)
MYLLEFMQLQRPVCERGVSPPKNGPLPFWSGQMSTLDARWICQLAFIHASISGSALPVREWPWPGGAVLVRLLSANAWRVVCLAALVAVAVSCLTVGREPLERGLVQLRQLGPLPYFSLFAIVISFGVPPTPFLLAAGGAFDLKVSLLGLVLSYAASLVISFSYSSRLFGRQLERFLSANAPSLALLLRENSAATILLARMTPGFPYVLQNCLLSPIARFGVYFLASMPPLVFMGMLYVALGQNLLTGRFGLAAVLLLILGVVLLIYRRVLRRKTLPGTRPS